MDDTTPAGLSPEQRMQRMRKEVREHNIYRWAGNLLTELSDIRIASEEPVASRSRSRL